MQQRNIIDKFLTREEIIKFRIKMIFHRQNTLIKVTHEFVSTPDVQAPEKNNLATN